MTVSTDGTSILLILFVCFLHKVRVEDVSHPPYRASKILAASALMSGFRYFLLFLMLSFQGRSNEGSVEERRFDPVQRDLTWMIHVKPQGLEDFGECVWVFCWTTAWSGCFFIFLKYLHLSQKRIVNTLTSSHLS